jgi:hypothetical protein
MTTDTPDDQLRLEIDATPSMAWIGLASALTPALEEAELSTSITVDHVGEHVETEYRSHDEVLRLAAAAVPPVVYVLRVYVPPALTDLALSKFVAGIDAAIRKWRRDTGNTGLVVPIYGPDGETIIRTVEREKPPTT